MWRSQFNIHLPNFLVLNVPVKLYLKFMPPVCGYETGISR
jgi:hypothetical protein